MITRHYGHVDVQCSGLLPKSKTLYTRARATDGSTMLAPMSPGGGKGLTTGDLKRVPK